MAKKLALITGYAKDPEFVKNLLLALDNQTYKNFDCYVYASPGCFYFLEETFIQSLNFTCYHLKLKENRGFAGNNNFTINEAFSKYDYKYAVLANDDTIPEDKWLEELLKIAEADESIGAVAPKMVFYQKFVTAIGITTSAKTPEDKRLLGIRFYANTGFAESFYPKKFYTKGFLKSEEDEINPFRWTENNFTIELPCYIDNVTHYILRLFISSNPAVKNQSLTITIGNYSENLTLKQGKVYYEIKLPASLIESNAHYIIQNAGGGIKHDATYEIGFGEIDIKQYNCIKEVELFCGGACLLSKKALTETGLFMDGLFSYYEDSDLSMRIRKKKYKIVYNPDAVIKHYHTGTSKEWSPLFTYYAFRNRIIFSAKTFGFISFAKAFTERSKETYVFFKLYAKSRFKNMDYRYRLKLNLVILKDALIGIIKFKPKPFPK